MMDAYALNWWQIAALLYLAIGVVVAAKETTQEAIFYYREDPSWREAGVFEFAFSLFFAAMVIVAVWPGIIDLTDDEEDY